MKNRPKTAWVDERDARNATPDVYSMSHAMFSPMTKSNSRSDLKKAHKRSILKSAAGTDAKVRSKTKHA